MGARAQGRPRFTHHRVDLAAGVVLSAIGLVAFWVGIRPVFHDEEHERRLRSQVVESRRQLVAAQEEYGQMRRTIEATRERLSRSTVVLHTAEGLATRQEEVSRAVADAGVEMEQLVVGTAVRGELLDTVPLHLSGSGTFPQVVLLVHGLRTGFPDMAVTSFQMSSIGAVAARTKAEQKSEKSVPTVRFVLDIAWYTARSEQPRG